MTEYISQLEGEIAVKVNENTDLRSQNRALMEENTRLSDLTRMLLSSPSFSGFLDTLASNPAAAQAAQAAVQQPPHVEQQQPQQRVRKDVNPFAAQQQMQHIGMTMVPEQAMDFSMLELHNDNFSYQPHVFSVLSLPESVIDTEVLSGKNSSFSCLASDDEKIELPTVERMPVSEETAKVEFPIVVDEEFDSDPAFSLYASSPAPTVTAPQELDLGSIIRNISLKPSAFELVTVSNVDEATSDAAMKKVERLASEMDACVDRLMSLTMHL